jgi:uncharacterized protein (TIGR00369 family)
VSATLSTPASGVPAGRSLRELREHGTVADFQALVDRIPYARFLGVEIAEVDERTILTKLRFDQKLVGNPNLPALHGGVLGAFLELAALIQLVREGEGEHLPKPVNVTVEYLRSAGPADCFARATITKHGRRVANVRAEAWQESPDKPVAAAHGHFLIPRD